MTLQGIVGRQIRRAIEESSPGERRVQTETVPSRREAPLKLESLLPRLPFFETGIWNPLAARLLGGPQAVSVPPNPPLPENQSKLLQGILSVEAASAELALLSEAAAGELNSEETHALKAYRKELVSRTFALEARLHEELNLLEEAISDRVDLLSGNESENEGESAVESELAEWEGRRCVVEEELASLATFREGLEELDGQGPAIWLEELAGTASDLLDLEWKYLEEDWAKSVEEIEVLAPRYVELARVQAKLVQLEIPGLPAMEALWVLRAEAELWAVTEARIEQFGQMMKTAGITDGIINLGGLTREDLTFAQEYSFRQSDYTRVHRYLTEGKTKEALELFQALEASQETRILFETIQEAEKINACTVNALTVVASGGLARIAMPIARGFSLLGNVSSRAIPAIQFGAQVGTFTVAHRSLNGWVMEQSFFDPNLSALENASQLSQEFWFNAGMFAFLGMSQKIYAAAEGRALHGISQRQGIKISQSQYGPMKIQADAAGGMVLKSLKNSPITQLGHAAGSFGTEVVAFAAWDYLAANAQALAQADYEARRVFKETLGSEDRWLDHLVFLAALKAGGALAAPALRPLSRSAEAFANARYRERLSELDRQARDCAEALEVQFRQPEKSLELLEQYQVALRNKAEFLEDLPEGLAHPAARPGLEAELQTVEALTQILRVEVVEVAANDGKYPTSPPRIGAVASPGETAANEGGYGNREVYIQLWAVGAELFVSRFLPTAGLMENGVRALAMAKEGENSSAENPESYAGVKPGTSGGKYSPETSNSSKSTMDASVLGRLRELRDDLEAGQSSPQESAALLGDLLQSYGLPQGEMLALEARKAAMETAGERNSPGYRDLCLRIRDQQVLLEGELKTALGEPGKHFRFTWEQGVVQGVELDKEARWQDLALLFEQPSALLLREIHFPQGMTMENFQGMLRLEAMSQVRVLSLRKMEDLEYALPHIRAIAGNPLLAGLRSLDLSGNGLDAAAVQLLAEGEYFGNLRRLNLRDNVIDEDGMEFLARSKSLHALEELDLGRNILLDAEGMQFLSSSQVFRNLESLNLDFNNIGFEGAQALAEGDALGKLRVLSLRGDQIGDAGLSFLAHSRTLADLEVLDLRGNEIGDEGLLSLARSAFMYRIVSLNLRSNNVGEPGIRALLGSGQLGRLQRLILGEIDIGEEVRSLLVARFGEGLGL